jgi:hypothetical protein
MINIARPGIGIIIGILIIIFRKKISRNIEKYYQRFPKYNEGVKSLKLKLSIRPLFIGAIGYILIFFSIYSFFYIVLN